MSADELQRLRMELQDAQLIIGQQQLILRRMQALIEQTQEENELLKQHSTLNENGNAFTPADASALDVPVDVKVEK